MIKLLIMTLFLATAFATEQSIALSCAYDVNSKILVLTSSDKILVKKYKSKVLVEKKVVTGAEIKNYSKEDLSSDTFATRYLKIPADKIETARDILFSDNTLLVNYFDKSKKMVGGALIVAGASIFPCK
jgi:hypothetical protein